MANPAKHITIQVDEEALREQVENSVRKVLFDMSMRLRFAADSLDNNEWINGFNANREEEAKQAYERGLAEGRAQKSTEVGD